MLMQVDPRQLPLHRTQQDPESARPSAPHAIIVPFSSSCFSLERSFRLARRIASAMNGATSFEKPVGLPWFRSVMRVPPEAVVSHAYSVSIGNGPSEVRIMNRSPGVNVTT